ncbi:hypothetical protein JCM3775_006781 [Rhodotorula graminis]
MNSTRPRMLSSQPKRSWGDSDGEEENARPEFELTADDWPPTPPKPRPAKPSTATASSSTATKPVARSASSTSLSKAGSAYPSSSLSRPIVSKPAAAAGPSTSSSSSSSRPLQAKPSSTSLAKKPLAPIFRTQSASASSSSTSTSRSTSAGSSAFAFNNPTTARSTGPSVLPTKRALPWEQLEETSSRSSRGGSANFHELSGPSGASRLSSGVKGQLLTSESMDIKQKVVLSPEQQMVLKMVVENDKNVFFTGSAGTGKSVLLREIIASLKRKYRGNTDAVAVTASTGMAACNIGGTTIHSFGGIGLGAGTAEQLVSNIRKNKQAVARWQRCKVLVIDEVSMVDGFLFDKLAKIAEAIKKNTKSRSAIPKPFGGIQLVVTGDFFQLPPVTKGTTPTFAFEADAWKRCIDHTVNLTQVFRQKDTEFIDMLNEMRFGRLSSASIQKFKGLARQPKYTDSLEPTELFPMRNEVDRANQNRLRALPGEETVFKAEDGLNDHRPQVDKSRNTYLSNFMAPETLVLKVGAQVMLIKNLDTTLVNGTVGTVVGFGVPELQESDDDDNGDEWVLGQKGEQVRSTTGGVKPERSAQEARKRQKVAEGVAAGKIEMGPVVDWQTPHGIERKVMVREEFKVEDNHGTKLAWRKQYPIILAWAMSIHKSQGQTIARVKVDLGKVFEKGQSYVALSRATSLEGLQVLRFEASKVSAHSKVVEWSRSLQVLG